MEWSANKGGRAPIRYLASMQQVMIDEAVPALQYLGIRERHPAMGWRNWTSFDRDSMNRLHKGGDFQQGVRSKACGFHRSRIASGGTNSPPHF